MLLVVHKRFQHAARPTARFAVAVLAASTVWLVQFAISGPTPALAQGTCQAPSDEWFGDARSGTGTTWGTQMATNMPATYFSPVGNATAEIDSVLDHNIPGQQYSGVELGWFDGTWPYPGPDYQFFYHEPTGFDTFDYGSYGYVITGPCRTASKCGSRSRMHIS